jgi:hypothetical protein
MSGNLWNRFSVSEKLNESLFKIWITVVNQRLIPTRTGQDIAHHISPLDIVSIKGNDIKVLSAGRVIDKFLSVFNRSNVGWNVLS